MSLDLQMLAQAAIRIRRDFMRLEPEEASIGREALEKGVTGAS